MSFLCSSTPSTSSSLVTKVAPRQMLSFLYPLESLHNVCPRSRQKPRSRLGKWNGSVHVGLENWFIASLADAGLCKGHLGRRLQSSSLFSLKTSNTPRQARSFSSYSQPRFRNSNQLKLEGAWDYPSKEEKPGIKRDPHSISDVYMEDERPITYIDDVFGPYEKQRGQLEKKQEDQGVRVQETEPEPDPEPEPEPKPRWKTALEEEARQVKEDLLAFVDDYSGLSFASELSTTDLPPLPLSNLDPLLKKPWKIHREEEVEHRAWPPDFDTKMKLLDLDLALLDEETDHEDIFQLYKTLPSPRVPYLTNKTRHKLLRHLSIVPRKDERSMMRYFSVVDDVKANNLPLNVFEWTSLLSFATKYTRKVSDLEVEAALRAFREMEHQAGVQANEATFNVLFDAACKGGKFVLAEMIYKEMGKRGLPFTRYHHVSIIYYTGLKQHGSGTREAYRRLVEAAEIVDTVVLNAVISALLRAKESVAAENIYARMKRSYTDRPESRLAPRNHLKRRSLTSTLMFLARCAPLSLRENQDMSVLAPDLQTFRILINHFAINGELDKTSNYLNEMALFKIPVHGAIFLAVFKGFYLHGGIRYTRWTEKRLESVFKSLLLAVENGVEDLYYSKWLVLWILKAFAKCSGKKRVVEVWEDIRERWTPTEEEKQFVLGGLRQILEGVDSQHGRHDWVLGTGYF